MFSPWHESKSTLYLESQDYAVKLSASPARNSTGQGASRWRKSKTRRSPSSPQIHQKYIYMWNCSYRTPTERWQKTSDLPKGKKLPTYLGRTKEKKGIPRDTAGSSKQRAVTHGHSTTLPHSISSTVHANIALLVTSRIFSIHISHSTTLLSWGEWLISSQKKFKL